MEPPVKARASRSFLERKRQGADPGKRVILLARPPAGRSSSPGKELSKQLWKEPQEISEAEEVFDAMSSSKQIVTQ